MAPLKAKYLKKLTSVHLNSKEKHPLISKRAWHLILYFKLYLNFIIMKRKIHLESLMMREWIISVSTIYGELKKPNIGFAGKSGETAPILMQIFLTCL